MSKQSVLNKALEDKVLSLSDVVHPTVLNNLERYSSEYAMNLPYRHIVIDDFLQPDLAAFVDDQFPAFDAMPTKFREPMSYKAQLSDIDGRHPVFSPLFAVLQSADFRAMVERISGITKLLADRMLAGGGLHQSPSSGFLDLHVDANYHPFDKELHRRVNLLIYVSREWRDEWGGAFELWADRNNKPDECVRVVSPRFNRAVIFSTTRTSWHGVAPIVCPPGRTRKSLALYYYSEERPIEEIYNDSSVIWMNRSVGWKRLTYPIMNFAIARLKPYAKYLHRRAFDGSTE